MLYDPEFEVINSHPTPSNNLKLSSEEQTFSKEVYSTLQEGYEAANANNKQF